MDSYKIGIREFKIGQDLKKWNKELKEKSEKEMKAILGENLRFKRI